MKKILYLLLLAPALSWADSTLSNLPETLTPASTGYLYYVSGGQSKKVQVGNVLGLVVTGGASNLNISLGGVTQSSPTAKVNFSSNSFTANQSPVGTANIDLNPAIFTPYLTTSSAAATYQPSGSYLTTASATATYLQTTTAANTYLAQSSAAATYQYNTGAILSSRLSGPLPAGVLVSSLTAVVTPGTYGSATVSPTITFNAQGQIIAASSNTITGGSGITGINQLTNGATNFIYNTNSLQSGSTFYTSSGTVAGQLNIGNTSSVPSVSLNLFGPYGSGSGNPLSFSNTSAASFTNFLTTPYSFKNSSGLINYLSFYVNSSATTANAEGTSFYYRALQDSVYLIPFKIDIPHGGGEVVTYGGITPGDIRNIFQSGSNTGEFDWSNSGNYFNFLNNVSAPALTASGLSSGQCVQTTTGGLLTVTGSACGAGGGGGASTLAVGTGTASSFTTNVTSPTAAISFLGSQFNSLASGSTNFVTLNGSSVTLYGPAIPASAISAGNLGTSVIASSIAVNAVQDASIVAVSASKLTGTGTLPNAVVDGSSITKQGNTFNGANQLLQLSASSLIPNANIDGSSITKQGVINLSPYLLSATASTTYLTQSSAAATYQYAGSYLTTSSATATYQPIGSYLTTSSAAATYDNVNSSLSASRLTGPLPATVQVSSFPTVNANVGTYTLATVTADAYGRITGLANGSASGGGVSVYPATATASFPLGMSVSTVIASNQISVTANADATIPLVVTGHSATQSANFQEWHNNGYTLGSFGVNATGEVLTMNNLTGVVGSVFDWSNGTTPRFYINGTGSFMGATAGGAGSEIGTKNTGFLAYSVNSTYGGIGSGNNYAYMLFGSSKNHYYGSTNYLQADPGNKVTIQTDATTKPALVLQGITSMATDYFQLQGATGTKYLWFDKNGIINSTGTVPVLTSCGTGPSIYGTDNGFTITGGTGATGCTATFGGTYTNAPSCSVNQLTMSLVNALSYTETNTAVTITQTGLGTNKLDVHCLFHG